MFTVVTYDVICDQRRNKIANSLKNFGSRVQKSVFECNLTRVKIKEMVKELKKLYDSKEDSIRIYYLCDTCRSKVKVYGLGQLTEDAEIYIV